MATHSTVHISTNLLTRTTVQLHNVPHKINANLVTNKTTRRNRFHFEHY